MSCECDNFDTLLAIQTIYNNRNTADNHVFISLIVNCIFISAGVRAAYLNTCDDIESEFNKIKKEDPVLFAKYCNQLITTTFPYRDAKMCMLYNRNGDTGGTLMPTILDLAEKIQLGRADSSQGELDRLIGAVLGYHCARNIHDVPSKVSYSVNASFAASDETFQIMAYGCPKSDLPQNMYYGRRILQMHFKMKAYLEKIGLNLSITTKIKSR